MEFFRNVCDLPIAPFCHNNYLSRRKSLGELLHDLEQSLARFERCIIWLQTVISCLQCLIKFSWVLYFTLFVSYSLFSVLFSNESFHFRLSSFFHITPCIPHLFNLSFYFLIATLMKRRWYSAKAQSNISIFGRLNRVNFWCSKKTSTNFHVRTNSLLETNSVLCSREWHARYTTEIAAFFIRAELFYVAAWTAPNLNHIMSPDTWWAFSIRTDVNKSFLSNCLETSVSYTYPADRIE